MFLPAFNAVRFGVPACQALFERVFVKTPIKMRGYVAVQKKLLTLFHALWKKDVNYDPLYHSQYIKDLEYQDKK